MACWDIWSRAEREFRPARPWPKNTTALNRPSAGNLSLIHIFNELNNRVSQLYQQVMNHEKMKDFNEAKAEAEKMVAHIDAIINTAMNGGDPMLVQEPQGGCSGSCSSCAGCH